MSFTLPTFNLNANIWHQLTGIPNDYTMPDLTVVCNMAPGRRAAVGWEGTFNGGVTTFLFPPLTDIRAQFNTAAVSDLLECPAGSGVFYNVFHVGDMGKGFANEHRYCLAIMAYHGYPFTVQGLIPLPVPLP